MVKLFSVLAALSVALSVSAQHNSSSKIPPQWLKKLPVASNDSFSYETSYAVGATLEIARQKCLTEILERSGMTSGMIVMSEHSSEETVSQNWENGKLTEEVDITSTTEISTKNSGFKLFVKEISEYWTRNGNGDYCLTKLYAVSKINVTPVFDNIRLTAHYGAAGAWRSAIVPGWGQFHKGANIKGGLILGGAAVFAGGIVLCESSRHDRLRKISQTHDINLIHRYSAAASAFSTARNLFIGGLAAIYLYGIIDAAAAPGALRVITGKSGKVNYSLAPAASLDGSIGIAAKITF